MNPSKYVIYARKSSESEDRQALSIESQVSELQRIAAGKRLAVAEVLTESKSAKAPGRPVFGSLLRKINRGEIQGVLSWKMDRLSRNHLDTGLILQALAEEKFERIITSDGIRTTNGDDRLVAAVESAFGTKYIDDLKANTRRGLRAREDKGWCATVPPLGYLNDTAMKTVITDPVRFPLVRRLWELLLRNVRVAEIHRIAREELALRSKRHGRAKGGPIDARTLYRIFANPFYTGMIRKGTKPGIHPPMVTREEFDLAQKILRRDQRERPKKYSFTYAGLLRCGSCGKLLTGEQHRRPHHPPYVYYRCYGAHLKACGERSISEGSLEAAIASHLGRLRVSEPVLEFLQRRAASTIEDELTRRTAVRRTLRESLERTIEREDNLDEMRMDDLITIDRFKSKKQALQDERSRLEQRLAASEEGAAANGQTISDVLDFSRRAHSTYLSGTVFQKRAILNAVAAKSEVRAKKVALEFKIPFRLVSDSRAMGNYVRLIHDVRKWLDEKTEFFALPDMDGEPEYGALPPLTLRHKVA